MNYIDVLGKLDDKLVVDFIKYGLKVQLEEVEYADYDDVIDIITIKQRHDDYIEYDFISDDTSRSIKVVFGAFDYAITLTTNYGVVAPKIENYESEETHAENRKKYINFVANQIGRYSDSARKDYINKASLNYASELIAE